MDLSAYRIVQEALTNVLKHSGPQSRTEVRLRAEGDGITIEVLDDGRGTAVRSVSAAHEGLPGHGIVGMRERASCSAEASTPSRVTAADSGS